MEIREPADRIARRTGLVALEPHAEAVLAVLREVVANERAAARAERQPFGALVLTFVLRHLERLGDGRRRWRANREAADLARGRKIALHQRLRDFEDPGNVVEPVARIICRQ